MNKLCDVCRGGKVLQVQLPYDPACPNKPQTRNYACPECATVVPDSRVLIMSAKDEMVIGTGEGPMYRKMLMSIRRKLAATIAEIILENGFFHFSYSRIGDSQRGEVFAQLGIVTPGQVVMINDRVSERQTEVACKVIGEVRQTIRLLATRGDNVSKQLVDETLERALFRAVGEDKVELHEAS